MDAATLATLASEVVKFILLTSAEGYVKEIGADAYRKTKGLKDWLWAKIKGSGEKKIQQATKNFEDDPETYQEAMTKALTEYLQGHPDVAAELAQQYQSVQASTPKFKTEFSGGTQQGINIGDNNTITQYFGDKTKPSNKK
jgi:hypothetical protein